MNEENVLENLLEAQLIETWTIHNRINLYLLAAIPDEAFPITLNSKGRSVYALLAHIHNVRLMWLKASAPDLLEGIEKLDSKVIVDRAALTDLLTSSGAAIEALVKRGLESGGKIKNFKPHATAFVGYLISHESHHRGQLELVLRYGGFSLDDKTSYGMWEWGTR